MDKREAMAILGFIIVMSLRDYFAAKAMQAIISNACRCHAGRKEEIRRFYGR